MNKQFELGVMLYKDGETQTIDILTELPTKEEFLKIVKENKEDEYRTIFIDEFDLSKETYETVHFQWDYLLNKLTIGE
jgi:alpha-N-acetylglucosamine transferase